ncbi:bifunctional alpha/beta hydrolase/OsmC family protein [Sphingomonas sp. PR090111-T3T-6A]|uniref:bifunctional alpha/beta hydrolase/OsmC family protein n=1 Tax=Sphingomonas sp. PR090111-T3T-6A TaxID=685778 RepID=UPI0003759B44|nr:bifunctional alpha/beta hydrolase/OsmC family protein [Sphingomonas sp. PR090111-T3T-6A]
MPSQNFMFAGSDGREVAGTLEPPATTPRGWAIFAHCFTCGKDSLAATRIARALAREGIGVLRFDFAGSGGPKSAPAHPLYATNVGDLVDAARAMAAAGMPPSLLIGHSLGGTAAIEAAGALPGIAAVAAISAPADVEHVLTQFAAADLERIEAQGEAEVEIAGRPFAIRRAFLDDVKARDVEAHVATLRRPLLLLHAPLDNVVGIEHASRLFVAAKHPKTFVSLDLADHLLTRVEDANYAASMIAAWASRYLPKLAADLPQLEVAQGVTASETGAGKLQVEIRSGGHRVLADEPAPVGGLGSGLSPYELVAAGLAACTVMTMRLYANLKGFPLERAHALVDHQKMPDMKPADRFTRTITLEGPLDEEQRRKILAIGDRCPVDLTLMRGSDVQTRLVENAHAASPDR